LQALRLQAWNSSGPENCSMSGTINDRHVICVDL
jgi:hypothetical protein